MRHTNITKSNQLVVLKSGVEVVIEPGQTINAGAVRTVKTDDKPTSKKQLKELKLYQEPAKESSED